MGDKSSIEWTDATWNPVRGCSIVSKGCTNCYAMKMAHRSSGAGGAYEGLTKISKGGPVWTGDIRLVPELLEQPLRWRRGRRIFVNSMSDLFHDDVPDSFLDKVFAVMDKAEQHIFQILTKRADRMRDYCARIMGEPLRNVWLGVSVEDQAAADERIPLLLKTPAAMRWISAEPLLGPVKLLPSWLHGTYAHPKNRPSLDWVVVGGESGPGARPMHPDWARALRDQCASARAGFFFKQWGAWAPINYIDKGTGHRLLALTFTKRETLIGGPAEGTTPTNLRRVGKRAAGRELDGRTHDEYPA